MEGFLSGLKPLIKRVADSRLTYVSACWYGICMNTPFDSWSGFIAEIDKLMNFMIGASGLLGVALLIWGGFTYMTAAGDPEKIDRGTKIVTNTVIGLVIVFISVLIVETVIRVMEGGGSF